ncbi:PLDc N-terminal domain-containing protein [Microcella sp.]|uniref:PLDc N-terminal domain-containing protein n=1 Tax=Microcella sp. TaxID=1913979 RepID=UPI0039B0DC5A
MDNQLAQFDILLTICVAAAIVISLIALVQILRSPATRGLEAAVWVAVVLFVPILGSVAWFIATAQRRPRRTTSNVQGR